MDPLEFIDSIVLVQIADLLGKSLKFIDVIVKGDRGKITLMSLCTWLLCPLEVFGLRSINFIFFKSHVAFENIFNFY